MPAARKTPRSEPAAKEPTEYFGTRVPAGFRNTLRQLIGHRMSVSGQRITAGDLLMSLVQAEASAVRHVDRLSRGATS